VEYFKWFKSHVLSLNDNALEAQIKDNNLLRVAKAIRENPDITTSELERSLGIDKSTINKVIKRYYNEVMGRSASVAKPPREEGAKVEEARSATRVGGGGGAAGFAEVMRTLGREYAEVLKKVTEKVDWFTDVVMDIGFNTVLAAFQFAKIPPERFMDKVEEFKDPNEFKAHVLSYLDAMLKSSSDGAARLVELEDERRRLEAYSKLLESMYMEAIEQRNKSVMYLRAAIASMCEDCLRRFTLAYAMSEVVGTHLGQQQAAQGQGGGGG